MTKVTLAPFGLSGQDLLGVAVWRTYRESLRFSGKRSVQARAIAMEAACGEHGVQAADPLLWFYTWSHEHAEAFSGSALAAVRKEWLALEKDVLATLRRCARERAAEWAPLTELRGDLPRVARSDPCDVLEHLLWLARQPGSGGIMGITRCDGANQLRLSRHAAARLLEGLHDTGARSLEAIAEPEAPDRSWLTSKTKEEDDAASRAHCAALLTGARRRRRSARCVILRAYADLLQGRVLEMPRLYALAEASRLSVSALEKARPGVVADLSDLQRARS